MADNAGQEFLRELQKIMGKSGGDPISEFLAAVGLDRASDPALRKSRPERSEVDQALRLALTEVVKVLGGGKMTPREVVGRVQELKNRAERAEQALRASPSEAEIAADKVAVSRAQLGEWARRLEDGHDPEMVALELVEQACSL